MTQIADIKEKLRGYPVRFVRPVGFLRMGYMKKIFLVILIFAGASGVYANGIAEIEFIPKPEFQIMLPSELVGIFEFPYYNDKGRLQNLNFYYVIEIDEYNRFLWRRTSPDFASSDQGHVIEQNGNYYFIPLDDISRFRNFHIREQTRIIFNENGFSFMGVMGEEFIAIRRDECIVSTE